MPARAQAAVVVGVILSSGCAGSMSAVLREKQEGQGTAQNYSLPADRAWQIAETILRWDGAATVEEHREGNYMLTTMYGAVTVQGADPTVYIGAWIEPSSGDQVKLTCVVSGPKPFATYTEEDFQLRFQQALELSRSGEPLPLTAPPRPRLAGR